MSGVDPVICRQTFTHQRVELAEAMRAFGAIVWDETAGRWLGKWKREPIRCPLCGTDLGHARP